MGTVVRCYSMGNKTGLPHMMARMAAKLIFHRSGGSSAASTNSIMLMYEGVVWTCCKLKPRLQIRGQLQHYGHKVWA